MTLPTYNAMPPLTPHKPKELPTYNGDITELDVSGFDASQVVDMSWLANPNGIMTEIDFSGFDTSQVVDMRSLGKAGFADCNEITLPLDWDTTDIESGDEMVKAWFAARDKPTPTIPQMTDRHERDVRIDQATVYLNWAWVTLASVVGVVFVVAMILRATVGVDLYP
jgi:surface protein